MTPNDALMANTKRLRKERGWTQAELAGRWGVTLNVATNLEGRRKGREFSVNEAVALAGVFGVTLADLLEPCANCQGTPAAGWTCQACGAAGKPLDGAT
jgi:transcriptional regulator with XRE-family HTH domain